MKRLTALFTAVALCLSLGLTALAAPVAAQNRVPRGPRQG